MTQRLAAKGNRCRAAIEGLIRFHGLTETFSVSGHPSWLFFNIRDSNGFSALEIKTLYLQEMFARGILTIGTFNFSDAHSEDDIDALVAAHARFFEIAGRALKEGLAQGSATLRTAQAAVQAALTGGPVRHVAIRADASVGIGHGHVMRCLALATALDYLGVKTTFVTVDLPAALEDILAGLGIAMVRIARRHPDQAEDCAAVLHALANVDQVDWMIVDHYGIDRAWERAIRGGVPRVAVIDDLANRPHEADVLLDPNLQASRSRYAGLVPGNCRLLLGPRFALLRPEFARHDRQTHAGGDSARRVVAFAGSGDAGNATGRILDAWQLIRGERPRLDVVIGEEHPRRSEIEARCAGLADVKVHVQTSRMAELLEGAQLFIGAAGGANWERCCLGVPALLFATAPNQESNLELFAKRRTGIALGQAADLKPASLAALIVRVLAKPGLLRRMAARAARLVDGRGARRAALAIAGGNLRLRDAVPDDVQVVWEWRNDPRTRRHSRDARALKLEEHRGWWRDALGDPGRRLFIGRCGNQDVGVLRFDSKGEAAELSIFIDPELTGLGLGKAMLLAGQEWASQSGTGWKRLQAEILPENQASMAAFAATGFRRQGPAWLWEVAR